MVSATMKARVARLSIHTNSDVIAKIRFLDWVQVCCDEQASSTDEPGECGSFGVIVIRSATREKYREIRDSLAAEGWLLLEG